MIGANSALLPPSLSLSFPLSLSLSLSLFDVRDAERILLIMQVRLF